MKKQPNKRGAADYVDDGRTLADMSGVRGGLSHLFAGAGTVSASFRDKWRTFWGTFKLMLLPTLVMVLFVAVLYGLMYLFFKIL